VTQGSTATIGVTVQNVGALSVTSSFNVVLTDQTAGVALGTQVVNGLAAGAVSTLSFNWNTTTAALGGHTLVATHSLTDANASNNERSALVTVNPPVTDVAVTAVNAPASVFQGSTATIGVTVQNVGGLGVGSFNVVLTDQTAGVTLGTQPVTGLAAGGLATLSFSWNTTAAALGGHTLVATHNLTDDNAANNQASATVTVLAQPTDLALTNITGPAQVTLGDIAPIVVTVQNVGGQNVTSSFDVVLTDGSAGGVTIGTQTIPGLAAGASATRTFNWNTTGVATGGHILIATQKLADNDATNNARAIGITVNAPSVHVGNLGGTATNRGSTWRATVQITAHDHKHALRSGVTVRGSWNGSGATVQCTTGSSGTCNIVLSSIPNSTLMVSFAVTSMTRSGYVYNSSANHDPDGSSNGFSIIVTRP
ncbi:MAG TPA: CARDB domain-containing protein, partial [Gemmatimonadales bacterium]|nr:CARDB domain-containing protein [Gemmatimonadales bacterium]